MKNILFIIFIACTAFADSTNTNSTIILPYSTNYASLITWTNSKPFAEVRNITKVGRIKGFDDWNGSISYDKPTNVEFIFYHEPIITKSTNGVWIVHFKD